MLRAFYRVVKARTERAISETLAECNAETQGYFAELGAQVRAVDQELYQRKQRSPSKRKQRRLARDERIKQIIGQ